MTDEVVEEPTEVSPEEPVAPPVSYDVRRIAEEVIAGHWSRGNRRKERLREAGYDPVVVLEEVHSILHS